MPISTQPRRITAFSMLAVVAAFMLVGCGGGGGKTPLPYTGRSFLYSAAGQTVSMSIDSANHFTIYAVDTSTLPSGAGAQGTIDSNRRFYAQSADGTITFSGAISSDYTSAIGGVLRNSQSIFTFTAPIVVETAPTPSGLGATFSGSSGGTSGLLSVDSYSHGTLWVQTSSTAGGALVTVASNGTFSSSDNNTTGSITGTTTNFELKVTKLNGAASTIDIITTPAARAKWTFLVYLNAANDLQNYGPLNVNQMENVGSTDNVNIVVQWKQADIRRVCASCGLPSFIATRRYLIKKDSNTSVVNSTLVQDLGSNVDMGDWRTLHDFISWGQQQYPADHYAVVVWNHGAGWRPTRLADNKLAQAFPRSVSIDDDKNTEIQTWQLPQALTTGQQPIDMLVFDASLMQMTEIAYELRSSAQIVVGSEESPPGTGYVYNTFLTDLTGNPDMTAVQFGTQIVNRTLQSYGSSGNNTQSVVDLSKMQNVADKLNAFGVSLVLHSADSSAAILNARNTADYYAYPDNKDLWHYADLIRTGTSSSDLKTAASNLQTAISAAVLVEAHGSLHSHSHGLAIYVPSPSSYLTSYSSLALSRVTNWGTWLQGQPL